MITPSYLEDRISQIPATRLLMAMGWGYLTPDEANRLRGNKPGAVILDGVLLPWLKAHNTITHKGRSGIPFTDANLNSVLNDLQNVPLNRGLIAASEHIYERLTLGKSVEQLIEGDRRSFDVKLIDWHNPANNVYHVTEEFSVERRGSHQTYRPDIVLFVNGIPLVVIECKRPDKTTPDGQKAVYSGVSQMLRNQHLDDGIPHLFAYTQLLMAVSVNDALYATTGTAAKFWAVWKEEGLDDDTLMPLINQPLTELEKSRLFDWRGESATLRHYFEGKDATAARLTAAQDRAIFSLLRPARLLELAYQFIVFDGGEKKVARYQQYFAVRSTVARVHTLDASGKRAGGVIWHTTGSGKSLTMVMLAKALALHPNIPNPRVIIVTDRIDLDAQIGETFTACGKTVYKATSGEHLMTLIREPRHEIITTVIDKFETVAKRGLTDPSPDIFVLVDESHRSQYGTAHARMRAVFPNGCYIGFTGTPLLKQEKTTAAKFGGFIHKYTMRQAVEDGAVVPLLYEGRMVDLDVSRDELDKWFERRTRDLNEDQKADLKRKLSRYEEVNRTQPRLEAIAWDIAEHYRQNWRSTGFKAQLATASKALALRYKQALEEEGIDCAVVISAPDTREGNEDSEASNLPEVQAFWQQMMAKYRTEEKYLSEIKSSFKREDGFEILIVVDKLLVGFDEPRNTVLYVDKPLREHGLLQAIARVNRLYQGKQYGYIIDYRGVLGELNEAMQVYNALEDFDTEDVQGTVTDVAAVLEGLPGLHDQLWSIFDPVMNKGDQEALERFLGPEDRRQMFYEALNSFANGLRVALGSETFYETTPEARINTYKRDLKFFHQLRTSVKLRYAESINYGEYEEKIRKLLNDHIKAGDVSVVVPEVNIFNPAQFEEALAEYFPGAAARAEAIAYRLKKTATEKMDEDPAFYRKFSQLVEETLQAYREGRLSERDFATQMDGYTEQMRVGHAAGLPPQIVENGDARAYYGLLLEPLSRLSGDGSSPELQSRVADLAIAFERVISPNKYRDWAQNPRVINSIRDSLDSLLYRLRDEGLALSGSEMDMIIESVIETARKRDAAT